MNLAAQILASARDALLIKGAGTALDHLVWEHSDRVRRLAAQIALVPGLTGESPEPMVVFVSALFHDGGWVVQFRQGLITPGQLLARPTSDVQRELGAQIMQQRVGNLLPPDIVQLAAATIRECNNRFTTLPEAQIVSEAENLDEIGVLSMLRQFRQYQFEGRGLEQFLSSWTRQLEYHYWDARINDFLRWEISRNIARERLTSVEHLMAAIARDRECVDLGAALRAMGIDPAKAFDAKED